MPTYEYRCRECGQSFDEYQPMSAEPLVVCPKCGKRALKRIMGTGGGLIFKGSGFYQTDYKKNGASPSSSSAKKDNSTGSATKEKKTDSTDSKPSPTPPKKD